MNSFVSIPIADLRSTTFAPTSRYHGLEILTYTQPDGREVAYVSRRFVPQPSRFETLREYSVTAGDRPDNIAATYIGDPEQFWRLADANAVLNPFELTSEAGRKIRITLPEGIPGAPQMT